MATAKPKKSPPTKSQSGQSGGGNEQSAQRQEQTAQREESERESPAEGEQASAQSQEQGMASNQSQSEQQPQQSQEEQGQQQPQQSQEEQGQQQQQPQQEGQQQSEQSQEQESQQQDQQSEQAQGQSEQEQDEQSGEEQSSEEGSDVTNVLDLDVQPVRLDLLGLVVKTEEIHVIIDAESGEGKLVGNLVGQLTTLLDTIDLSALTGNITETLQNTMTGLAGEASNQVQQQGSQLIGSAVQSLGGYLQQKMPGAGAAGEAGGQAKDKAQSAASGGE